VLSKLTPRVRQVFGLEGDRGVVAANLLTAASPSDHSEECFPGDVRSL
jgi:hypothetical protein